MNSPECNEINENCPERERCLREYGVNLEWTCRNCTGHSPEMTNQFKIKVSFEDTSGCQKIIIAVNKNKQDLDRELELSQTAEQFLKTRRSREIIEKIVQYR